jgi:hypothetical protein
MLMAINNLEKRCLNRKEGTKNHLQYPLDKMMNLKDPGNMGNLELFKKRADFAKYQLYFIG